jgi:hypothetical protein
MFEGQLLNHLGFLARIRVQIVLILRSAISLRFGCLQFTQGVKGVTAGEVQLTFEQAAGIAVHSATESSGLLLYLVALMQLFDLV